MPDQDPHLLLPKDAYSISGVLHLTGPAYMRTMRSQWRVSSSLLPRGCDVTRTSQWDIILQILEANASPRHDGVLYSQQHRTLLLARDRGMGCFP